MGTAMGTAWGLHGDCMGTVLYSPHATNIGQIQSRLQIYRELSHGDCTRLTARSYVIITIITMITINPMRMLTTRRAIMRMMLMVLLMMLLIFLGFSAGKNASIKTQK